MLHKSPYEGCDELSWDTGINIQEALSKFLQTDNIESNSNVENDD